MSSPSTGGTIPTIASVDVWRSASDRLLPPYTAAAIIEPALETELELIEVAVPHWLLEETEIQVRPTDLMFGSQAPQIHDAKPCLR